MKRFVLAFAAMAVSFGFTEATQAAFITGTQALAVLSEITASPTDDISTDNVFSGIEFTTTAAQTGDYVPFGTSTFASTTLDVGTSPYITFGDGVFGTFTGASIIDGGYNPATFTRSFSIIGSFAPGSFFGSLGGNSALLSLSFTQVGGQGTAISASASLITPNPVVPEPGTLVMLGTFCGPVALGLIRRRQVRKAKS
ncbi:MAG: PEP-CTERM sorting domain-containing protein [Planctomycetaceae bacterium]